MGTAAQGAAVHAAAAARAPTRCIPKQQQTRTATAKPPGQEERRKENTNGKKSPAAGRTQVSLHHRKVGLKGCNLLAQHQQLLDGEELGVHHALLLQGAAGGAGGARA